MVSSNDIYIDISLPDPDADKMDPISLTDYSISMPRLPTEAELQRTSLSFFEDMLIQKYNFTSIYDLNRSINIIQDFEKE